MTKTAAYMAIESIFRRRAYPITQNATRATGLQLTQPPDLNDPIRIEIQGPFYFTLE
jgi:hypothetical protein